MKKLLCVFLLLSTSALAQVKLPTNEAGLVQYQEIVRIGDGKEPARQVFNQLQSWAVHHYPSQTEAERHDDEAHGIVFVRSLYLIRNRSVRYTLTIEARIGRYRATITDLVAENKGLAVPVQPVSPTVEELKKVANGTAQNDAVVEQIATEQVELYQQIDNACRTTLASLKQAMTSTAK